jgi:hypothetical protein
MKGEYVVMINGKLETFTDYYDIPNTFQHVIKFQPELIPEPHTPEQHEEIETWNDKLKRLMEIEHASSNKNR